MELVGLEGISVVKGVVDGNDQTFGMVVTSTDMAVGSTSIDVEVDGTVMR
tara:strand:+ start:168 stop:317 length:150 start_codon:yes stop_codon:yes gene_type:complete